MISEAILAYCEAHSAPQSDILADLERETYIRTLEPQMISGHLQGRLLALLSRLIRPKVAVDIGTFTGYSALCIAEGLAEDGLVHTIDTDDERGFIARNYAKRAGFRNHIVFHQGRAADILPTITAPFDFVFIDADKESYGLYFDIVVEKTRPGGLIIADNVLWKGRVVEPNMSAKTAIIDAFNAKIAADSRVEPLMLPIRDGLSVMFRV